MTTKRALVIGCGGQDGSCLCDILLERGYEVHGIHRHTSHGNLSRISHCLDRIRLHRGDMGDPASIYRIVSEVQPQEIYNEADQDNVNWSRALPGLAARITYTAVADLLEIVRQVVPQCRVFQPCSSTMFGTASALVVHDEVSPLDPQSPYAVAKVAAYHLARYYRRQYGLHVSCGILFNHTSVRQTEEYLLHKICAGVVRIAAGKQQTLALGNLETRVDIGCAHEYMVAAWQMLQQDVPDDYVLSGAGAWSIREMVSYALLQAGLASGRVCDYVTRDPRYYQDAPTYSVGSNKKARLAFGFEPQRPIAELIHDLVTHYQAQGQS